MNIKYSLNDTVDWMLSDDWRVRIKAEYWQLVIRMERLRMYLYHNFIHHGKEEYYQMMMRQFGLMKDYKLLLEERCKGVIDLDNEDVYLS